jgi:hypothetical protein
VWSFTTVAVEDGKPHLRRIAFQGGDRSDLEIVGPLDEAERLLGHPLLQDSFLTRMLVHESIYDEVIERVAATAKGHHRR